jgi:hypothetical protein
MTSILLNRSIQFEIMLKVGIILAQTGQQTTRENVIQKARKAKKEGLIIYGY